MIIWRNTLLFHEQLIGEVHVVRTWSFMQIALCVTMDVDLLSSVKPSHDCNPGWQLECKLMRDSISLSQRTLPSHSLDQKEKAYLELFMSMFGAQFMDSHCLSVKARRYRRKRIPKNSLSDHLCFEHWLLTQSTYYHLLSRVLRQVLPAFCARILVDISDKVDWSVLFLTLLEVYMIFWGFVFWFCLFGALFLIMEWHF